MEKIVPVLLILQSKKFDAKTPPDNAAQLFSMRELRLENNYKHEYTKLTRF